MRLRKVRGAENTINASPYIISNPRDYKGKINELFNNKNKALEIEIGMGKGKFIIDKALSNPNINYIGIEKFDSVIVRAVQRAEEFDIPNLKLIKMDANEIDEVFSKEIDTIYLNFSDPWPKKRHASRRLTSRVFLDKYDLIFKDVKTIVMKTDNRELFDFSIESFEEKGYNIDKISYDLYSESIDGDNIPTEYETRFVEMGKKINFAKVSIH